MPKLGSREEAHLANVGIRRWNEGQACQQCCGACTWDEQEREVGMQWHMTKHDAAEQRRSAAATSTTACVDSRLHLRPAAACSLTGDHHQLHTQLPQRSVQAERLQ